MHSGPRNGDADYCLDLHGDADTVAWLPLPDDPGHHVGAAITGG